MFGQTIKVEDNPPLSLDAIKDLIVAPEPMEVIVPLGSLSVAGELMYYVSRKIYNIPEPLPSGIIVTVDRIMREKSWILKTKQGIYFSKGDGSTT